MYARVTSPEIVPYDPAKDLEPLALHLFVPGAVAVREESPWKTFAELVDHAKKNPGKLRISTIGQGSIQHFNMEITQSLTGAEFTHIPFKGATTYVTSLLGGHVEVAYGTLTNLMPYIESEKKSERLKILLLTKKVPKFPNIPTMSELGYKQDQLSTWFALYAPAGVPEDVKKVLVPALEKAIKDPDLKTKTEKLGFLVEYRSPAELRKLMIEDYERASAIAVKIGLRK